MKDQYFGDVNDYRKYGLLRVLSGVTQLPIGVCWMLTAPDGRSDGEFRRYLERPERWRRYDPELYDRLRLLREPGNERSVQLACSWGLIPDAKYREEMLEDNAGSRRAYFDRAWTVLAACPIIFLDPDNGVEVPSTRPGAKGSSRYVYWDELAQGYERGHSLLIYQHFIREKRDGFIARLATQLAGRLRAPLVDSFRTAHVVFFLVARPEHAAAFERAHDLIHDRWAGQIRASAYVAG
jgi:hypothetical protein